jgi:hypothetical protein
MGWKHHQNNKKSNFAHNLLWTILWTLIYAGLYLTFNFLLKEIFGNFNFLRIKFIYILLMGFCFSISSRIIWSLIHKKRIYLGADVFLYWTFAYSFSIWFGQFLDNLIITKLNYTIFSNIFLVALIVGIIVDILIKLTKKIEFGFGKRKFKSPSQVAMGIILLVAGILTFRFSNIIFVDWFKWYEGLAWSGLIGLGLIIGGILTLIAWWRNNVISAGKHFGFAVGKKHWI